MLTPNTTMRDLAIATNGNAEINGASYQVLLSSTLIRGSGSIAPHNTIAENFRNNSIR